MIIESKILRKIYGPKRNEWENTHERRTIFNELDIVVIFKNYRQISCTSLILRAESQTSNSIISMRSQYGNQAKYD